MTTKRTYILVLVLFASTLGRTQTAGGSSLTAGEYRAELERLLSATQSLSSSSSSAPDALRHLPESWKVHTDQKDFEISTEGLKTAVRRYEQVQKADNAIAIRSRLESFLQQLDGFEKPTTDVNSSRSDLNSILRSGAMSRVGKKATYALSMSCLRPTCFRSAWT